MAGLGAGMRIFRDILRRADKNDDGKLSFDEFKAYFADGVLSGEELHELFHMIDTHNTNNLDTEELCEYFSQHLGEYGNVLSVLENLNLTILKAMDKTKKLKSRRKKLVKMFECQGCKSQSAKYYRADIAKIVFANDLKTVLHIFIPREGPMSYAKCGNIPMDYSLEEAELEQG